MTKKTRNIIELITPVIPQAEKGKSKSKTAASEFSKVLWVSDESVKDVDVDRPKKRRFLFPKITIVEGPVEGFVWLCIGLACHAVRIAIIIFAALLWSLAIALRVVSGVIALGYLFAKLTSDKRRF